MDLEDRLHRGLLQRIRRTISPYLLSVSLGVLGYACGNGSEPSPPQGCVTNQDCKGDRVCYQGACFYPQGRGEQPREGPDTPPPQEPDEECVPRERLECRDKIVYRVDNCGSEQVYERCEENQRCVVDHCVDSIPGECQNGQREEIPCGLNNNGTLEKVCRSEQWQYSECNDPDICANGTREERPCGLNERGTFVQDCVTGQWVPQSCNDPDECVLGAASENYDGPAGTNGVGACQSRIEECVFVEGHVAIVVTREQTVPSAELCGNDIDEDCDGDDMNCGLIAFTSYRDGPEHIYIMNYDGTGIRYVNGDRVGANRDAFGFDPTWSPTNDRVAFSRRNIGSGIYTIDVGGGGASRRTTVTEDIRLDLYPSWSPVEDTITFTAYRRDGTSYEIYTISTDGGDERKLTDNEFTDTHSAWSPDGERIAFSSDRNGSNQLYVMHADGSDVQRLTSDGNNYVEPSWSPDGTKIAFARGNPLRGEDYRGIYIIDVESQNLQRLTDTGAHPTWSPDSRRIAFANGRNRNDYYTWTIAVMDSDGGNRESLTEEGRNGDIDPEWSK